MKKNELSEPLVLQVQTRQKSVADFISLKSQRSINWQDVEFIHWYYTKNVFEENKAHEPAKQITGRIETTFLCGTMTDSMNTFILFEQTIHLHIYTLLLYQHFIKAQHLIIISEITVDAPH